VKAFRGYKQYIEWDQIATNQGWQPSWVEDMGLAIGFYLNECVQFGRTPTFDGFFAYLEPRAPKEDAKERGKEGR
jgi:hypothetical protein